MESRTERILNLLVDEIEERLRARQEAALPSIVAVPPPSPTPAEAASGVPPAHSDLSPAAPRSQPKQPEAGPEPSPLPTASFHTGRLLGRLALGVLALVVIINVPFNKHGTTLATAWPDSAALIVRDGLVVKEENDPDIYVYQDGVFRWISSLEAFEHYGYTWGDVHIVEDGYLDDFEIGAPLYVLLKCPDSPHIYRLEEGRKRWIRDIETFTELGYVWEDVRFVSCEYLRSLPDGETLPPGLEPPQP